MLMLKYSWLSELLLYKPQHSAGKLMHQFQYLLKFTKIAVRLSAKEVDAKLYHTSSD